MMGGRRGMVFVSLMMWVLATTGFWTAGELWIDYDLCWRKFFEIPLGPALLIGFLVISGIIFFILGVAGVLWATEEEK